MKIHSRTHQIASFKKNFSGEHAPEPPNNAHGFATCKFPNLKKIFLAPPPKSWGRPCSLPLSQSVFVENYH